MKFVVLSLCFLLCLFHSSLSHQNYQSKIPNGAAVPNPCNPATLWKAVGHYHPDRHTFYKNPFAADFYKYSKVWTTALCQADSDGDGKTNGEELGDPNCVWTERATPESNAVRHPGICEPVGSAACSHQNFDCVHYENTPGLENSMPH